MSFLFILTVWNILCISVSTPINEARENDTSKSDTEELVTEAATGETILATIAATEQKTAATNTLQKIFNTISVPITKIIAVPKINNVLRNIGTCLVNGVLDIITHYLPAPFIPLIAGVAGNIIPFEPVITLRRLMPVTSYKRAVQTAVNGFLNTFNRFKLDDDYMTGWYRRSFLNDVDKENKDV